MITVNIVDHWQDTKRQHVVGTLVASGNYVTGGDTINFGLPLIKSNSAPLVCHADGLQGGYWYSVALGTSINNSKLKVFNNSTSAELVAGAYPAAVTGDVITFYAVFPKFI